MSKAQGSKRLADLVLLGCESFLRPIASFCLRAGVGYKEFAEVTKRAFVAVAGEEYGIRGRPTNTSRVAVLTGLTRKEVSRIRLNLESKTLKFDLLRSPVNRVMENWHSDPDFHNRQGPLWLPYDGDSPNFLELVRRYGGDIPPKALLKELERGGAIESSGGRIHPVVRFFEPDTMDDEFVTSMFFSLTNLANTLRNNAIVDRSTKGFIERYVWSNRLSEEALRLFSKMSQEKAVEFLDALDTWLVGHMDTTMKSVELDAKPQDAAQKGAGLGVYYFELEDDDQ